MSPSYRASPPVLTLAAVALVASALLFFASCECDTLGCDEVVRVQGDLPVTKETTLHLIVDLCRGQACSSGTLRTDDPGPYAPTCVLEGNADARCGLPGSAGPYWYFQAIFEPGDGAGELEDGDLITVRLADESTGNVVLFVQQPVDYTEATTGCGDTCKQAEILLPPP